ncbi:MAG: hypothetical protein GKS03_12605 [Alphaproteobacteria bacterium]|nr:hypothetical protein [Alphaproteobacteria bacterium]
MSQLDDLLEQNTAPSWRLVAYGIMGLLGMFLLWSAFADLDEVAIAPGEVVPQGRVKTIQHLEGGIIDELFVRDGDTVRLGTPLVQMDLAGTVTNIEELQVRRDGFLIRKARLEAEANGTPLTLPTDLVSGMDNIIDAERQAHDVRRPAKRQTAIADGSSSDRK